MSEQFEGSASQMDDSPWLKVETMVGIKELPVTIKGLHLDRNVKFVNGAVKDKVFSLSFEGKKKRLIITPTRRKSLVGLFGQDTKQWKDKRIVLYVDPKVRMGKEVTGGIRIKEAKDNG